MRAPVSKVSGGPSPWNVLLLKIPLKWRKYLVVDLCSAHLSKLNTVRLYILSLSLLASRAVQDQNCSSWADMAGGEELVLVAA